MKMPFGKHKGIEVHKLPNTYLQWLYYNVSINGTLLTEVCYALGIEPDYVSNTKTHTDNEMVMSIIKSGFRELSKKLHPDVGGTDEQMKKLNSAHEYLKRLV